MNGNGSDLKKTATAYALIAATAGGGVAVVPAIAPQIFRADAYTATMAREQEKREREWTEAQINLAIFRLREELVRDVRERHRTWQAHPHQHRGDGAAPSAPPAPSSFLGPPGLTVSGREE